MDENKSNYTQESTENDKGKQKKGKKGFYLKIIALALCCSLFGGLIGGGAVFLSGNYLLEKNLPEMIENSKEVILENGLKFRHPLASAFYATKEYVKEEIVKEPYIGISVTNSDDPQGALIDSVEKGSPAAKGNLQEDDVVTMVNNAKIYNSDELADVIAKSKSGDELTLTVYRHGETLDCKVIVGEHSRFGD